VPLNRMEQKEAQKLLKMEEELKQQVIGQDEAVIAISKALRRSRADLKDPRAQSGHSSSWVQPASEKRFWHVPWRSSCLVTPTL
jgi:ATPases with chaperone activity, ATP-binding subunit